MPTHTHTLIHTMNVFTCLGPSIITESMEIYKEPGENVLLKCHIQDHPDTFSFTPRWFKIQVCDDPSGFILMTEEKATCSLYYPASINSQFNYTRGLTTSGVGCIGVYYKEKSSQTSSVNNAVRAWVCVSYN